MCTRIYVAVAAREKPERCIRLKYEIAIRKQFVTVENDQNILTSQLEYLEWWKCFRETAQFSGVFHSRREKGGHMFH